MKRFLLLIVIVYATSQFCKKQTDGFAMNKVSTLLLDSQGLEIEEEYLQQPYSYLSKGGQSYVFVSEDGQYVLKLLRSSRLNTLKILYTFFPLSSFEEKIDKQEKLLKETLKSYAIAYEKLREETGLVGLHVDKQNSIQSPLKIVDKGGVAHIIDPNQYPFIVQKRAILVKEKIHQLAQEKNFSSCREAFTALFSLMHHRMEEGIDDGDPNLSKNFGFCGNHPIQIDTGRFSLSDTPSVEKISQSKEDLQHWINKYHPELSTGFNEVYEEFIREAL